jgi:hypothetical protein
MSARDTADRFTVKYDVPKQLQDRGFVAYVHDAYHPGDPAQGGSMSWHLVWEDAQRTARRLEPHLPETRATAENPAAARTALP